MKRVSIELKKFRGMEAMHLSLAEGQVTLIASVNGAGKSTVVDAVAPMLSLVVAHIRHAGTLGRAISEEDINNQANDAQIRTITINGDSWVLTKTRKTISVRLKRVMPWSCKNRSLAIIRNSPFLFLPTIELAVLCWIYLI